MTLSNHKLKTRLEVDTEFGTFLGDTRISLLEAIDKYGSISRAAKTIPISYKTAWDAIDAMNNLAEQPLVIGAAGGRNGGGTQLTDYGQRVIALYRAVEAEYQQAMDRLAAQMDQAQSANFKAFQQLLRRMSMQTSARNQFAGKIVAMRSGEVDFEVRLQLDDDNEIVSVITRESAESMQLQLGMELFAIVKSSSVLLMTDQGIKTTARNKMRGQIARIHDGPVNSEISLQLAGGKTVCAVVTRDSVERLELKEGATAVAFFKASSVLLCKR